MCPYVRYFSTSIIFVPALFLHMRALILYMCCFSIYMCDSSHFLFVRCFVGSISRSLEVKPYVYYTSSHLDSPAYFAWKQIDKSICQSVTAIEFLSRFGTRPCVYLPDIIVVRLPSRVRLENQDP